MKLPKSYLPGLERLEAKMIAEIGATKKELSLAEKKLEHLQTNISSTKALQQLNAS